MLTTISILIDALRHDYITKEDSPFLYSLQKSNIHGAVRETFAFQLRPAFFAGLYPESCDISYLYMYDPENSPFKIIDDIAVPVDVAENTTVNREYRAQISEAAKKIEKSRGNSASACYASTQEIPLNMLKYFSFSEKKNTFEPNALPGTTLFDILESHNMKWLWIAYPTDDQRTTSILEKIKQTDLSGYNFIFLHFAELDWVGHSFGPGSKEQKKILKEIDSAVEEIFKLFSAKFAEFNGIIFGDHGMVNIGNTINIESELLKSGLSIPDDFVYFLDSTQARFWFKNEPAKRKIIDLLKKFETHGKILNTEDYAKLHIRYTHNKFGELYFVINDGGIIYPNFFQRTGVTLGMHGYLPEVKDNWAAFIVFETGQQKIFNSPVELVDIFPTMLHLLNLPIPNSSEGTDILKDFSPFKFFSIIIPTYNRKDLLKQTLESFEKLSYPKIKFEIIVVDDGSTDGTNEFLENVTHTLGYSLTCYRQSNKGPASARNKGIELASGEIILFTGDDCIPNPDLLDEHNRYYQNFNADNNMGILGFTGIHPDIEITPFIEYLYISGHQFAYPSLINGKEVSFEYYYTTNLSLPREKIIEIGGFDEEFPSAAFEDIELGYRLSQKGFKLIYNQNAVTLHKHPTDLSQFIERSFRVGEAAIIFFKLHPELKDWWLGIDAMVNPTLRNNYFDSVLKYAELLGMERALRRKIQKNDPKINEICEILDDKRKKYQNHLEQVRLEQIAKISGLQCFLQTLEAKNTDYQTKISNLEAKNTDYQTKISNLEAKNTDYQTKISNLEAGFQKLETQVIQLQFENTALKRSIVWKITTAFHKKIVERLLPQGTIRREYFDLGIKGGRLVLNEGVRYTISEFKSYRKTKKYESIQKRAPNKVQTHRDDLSHKIRDIVPNMRIKNITGYVPLSENHITLTKDDIKYIAFYLPQFHPIPENDQWWGKGFTEWTNVTKAVPQFKGHYQPRLPDELGFYDLRLPEIQKRQIELARQYGIFGFCFHYYWFNGNRLLDRPLNQFIENKEHSFPFCICWANENWTRRWDGMENEILIAQNHSPESDISFIKDLVPILKDFRYIRIDGKPLVIVYRATLLPDSFNTTNRWREYCRTAGIGEIYLVTTLSFGCDDPRKFGFDAAVEFPPHTMTGCKDITHKMDLLNPNFTGKIFDYADFVQSHKFLTETPFTLFKTVSPGWDNTARRSNNSHIFHHATPQLYQEWLYYVTIWTQHTHPPEERIVFINAWNEWAEGAYLEPDKKFGYGYLQATEEVLVEMRSQQEPKKKIIIVSHDAHPHGAQMIVLNIVKRLEEQFHYKIYVLLKTGGVLKKEFEKYAEVYDLQEDYNTGDALERLIHQLSISGCHIALTNTIVSGDLVPLLLKEKIVTISLIHELPGIIRDYHIELQLQTIANYSQYIIFPSCYVKNQLQTLVKMEEKKCIIAPQGLYLKNCFKGNKEKARVLLREQFNLPQSARIVLGVGYADLRKGTDLFAQVAKAVINSDKSIYFVWVGHWDKSFMSGIDKFIKKSRISENVIFPGRKDDMSLYYAGSDLLLLPSREDPFPSVILEALDVSVPVIGFDCAGGFNDIITSDTGILVPYLDCEEMSKAVIKLISNNQLREMMGSSGSALIDKKYRFDDYVYTLLSLLNHTYKKISVIIPNYNYERYLKRRMQSILEQNYPIYEIIILDDCSTDKSVQLIEDFVTLCPVKTTIVKNETNSGSVFFQWAKGISLAQGDYIWIAEADDLSETDFLKEVICGFKDPDTVISYCQSKQIDEKGRNLAHDYLKYTDDIDNDKWKNNYIRNGIDEIRDSLVIKNTIPNVSAVIFKKVNFNEILDDLLKFKITGDWFFYVWMLQKGKISFVAKSLNLHRRHKDGVTLSENKQLHFGEIVYMQDYIMHHFDIDENTVLKTLQYREEVRNHLLN